MRIRKPVHEPVNRHRPTRAFAVLQTFVSHTSDDLVIDIRGPENEFGEYKTGQIQFDRDERYRILSVLLSEESHRSERSKEYMSATESLRHALREEWQKEQDDLLKKYQDMANKDKP